MNIGNVFCFLGKLFHYTPGRDREILHKLEMDFMLPAKSTVTLRFMVEKRHLKWDEYPPDANHGFYLEPAHFEVNYTSSSSDSPSSQYYYSRKLLVNLSTPDFSMPYNVICLTCTVVALAFGPIHNITTKNLRLKVIVSKNESFKKLVNKILRRNPPAEESATETDVSADTPEDLTTTEEVQPLRLDEILPHSTSQEPDLEPQSVKQRANKPGKKKVNKI